MGRSTCWSARRCRRCWSSAAFCRTRDEAARLASAQYQQVLAQGIAEAVVHYFNADAAVGNL